jgi:hypothetical protein
MPRPAKRDAELRMQQHATGRNNIFRMDRSDRATARLGRDCGAPDRASAGSCYTHVPLAAPQGAALRRNIFSSAHGAATHPMVTRGLVQKWMEEAATNCGATTT